MTTTLRQVLSAFETTKTPRTLNQLARDLGIPLNMLEGMLDYWVRKGKLRESKDGVACGTCGGVQGCPFAPKLPHSYELVTDDSPPEECSHKGCGCR
ncbi:MAG: hypothetical protein HY866_05765 [Chloroflexi bacterium]|nr:hypothetical protein [Chloroflexota bacterium]